MDTRTLVIGSLALVLAALFAADRIGLFETAASSYSQTSAVAAPPEGTPTYVSEIGTALTISPRDPAQLPASGSGGGSGSALPLVVGLTLAGTGVLLIHAARGIGRDKPRHAI